MEIVLTTAGSNELLDIDAPAHASFTVLMLAFPRSRSISWVSLAEGSKCVLTMPADQGGGIPVRRMGELDGIWHIDRYPNVRSLQVNGK